MNQTQIMGILNVTPDSFYQNCKDCDFEKIIAYGVKLSEEGADIIDVGGESSRPGAQSITLEEEIIRVIPVVKELKKQIKTPISVDTVKPEVAKLAI
jgi:dihydropteroate synthase